MSREKQIEEMTCEKCLHYEMCLEKFRNAKNDGFYEFVDEEEYFSHADECDFFVTGYRKQSEGEYEYLTCSECGHYHWSGCDSTAEAKERLEKGDAPNFCPNCGAKMKGV